MRASRSLPKSLAFSVVFCSPVVYTEHVKSSSRRSSSQGARQRTCGVPQTLSGRIRGRHCHYLRPPPCGGGRFRLNRPLYPHNSLKWQCFGAGFLLAQLGCPRWASSRARAWACPFSLGCSVEVCPGVSPRLPRVPALAPLPRWRAHRGPCRLPQPCPPGLPRACKPR